MLHKKLDENLAKNYLDCYSSFEIQTPIRHAIAAIKSIHEDETTEIHKKGLIINHVINIGSYENIGRLFSRRETN